jgi:truncated hemoglobin YjbI
MCEPPTLFQWAQGRPAIDRLINCFYDRVQRDDLLSPFFPGGVSAEHDLASLLFLSENAAARNGQRFGNERMREASHGCAAGQRAAVSFGDEPG